MTEIPLYSYQNSTSLKDDKTLSVTVSNLVVVENSFGAHLELASTRLDSQSMFHDLRVLKFY